MPRLIIALDMPGSADGLNAQALVDRLAAQGWHLHATPPPAAPIHALHAVGPHVFINDGATPLCAVSTCRRPVDDHIHHVSVTVVTSGDPDDKEPPT
jgi:hypothetical protein